MYVKVADYKDLDCRGCTCCYVTVITPDPDEFILCDACEAANLNPALQVECLHTTCNVFKAYR